MLSYAEALAEDRRLAMLRLLVEARGEANESVLSTGLEMLGHAAGLTRDNIRADLKFLNDRALVTLSYFNDWVCVAKITRRGVEVSEGRTHVDGVKRPSIRGLAMPRFTIVDKLPKDVRESIKRWREDERLEIDEIIERLRKEFAVEIKRSTMGLAVKKIDQVGRKIRETRAVAEGVAPTLSGKDDGELLNMNIELLHGAIMQISSATDEDGQDIRLKASEAMQLGKALECAAKAQKTNADRVLKIEHDAAEKAKKKAVNEVDQVAAKTPGLSKDTVDDIKRRILGIAT